MWDSSHFFIIPAASFYLFNFTGPRVAGGLFWWHCVSIIQGGVGVGGGMYSIEGCWCWFNIAALYSPGLWWWLTLRGNFVGVSQTERIPPSTKWYHTTTFVYSLKNPTTLTTQRVHRFIYQSTAFNWVLVLKVKLRQLDPQNYDELDDWEPLQSFSSQRWMCIFVVS